MAQLSDDCFAFGGRLIPLAEAEAQIAALHFRITAPETVPLVSALGRVLAEDVVAPAPVPPLTNAAVDGYAVHFDDLDPARPTLLRPAGRATAGHPSDEAVPRGAAARVFTGAVMPPGPDTVLMQEDCTVTPEGVLVRPGIRRGANRRLAGEDIDRGALALPAGRRLAPPDLALLAAIGCRQVAVRQKLRVALFSTGDEVTEPGMPLAPGRIYDANRFMLAGLLHRLGVAVTDGGILPDQPECVRAALSEATSGHDVVLTSGGVSTGEEDHVRSAIEAIGRIAFWRVAIRPGRPVAMGEALGKPLIGLPGNPVAALVTFATIARPVLDRLAGALPTPLPRFPVLCAFGTRKKPGRREFLRVRLERRDGALHAHRFPKDGAGIITSLTESDALLELPEDMTAVAPGDPAAAIPLSLLYG